jgi:catechol 2,3-dioxygenase-like lactoylglutathione lyase family enzyme
MRFGHLELFVADPLRSLEFYTDDLGFQLIENQDDRFIWVERGGLTILIQPGKGGGSTCVVYYTETLDEEVAALRERGVKLEFKANCYHFRDLDGHEFQIVHPDADHSGG